MCSRTCLAEAENTAFNNKESHHGGTAQRATASRHSVVRHSSESESYPGDRRCKPQRRCRCTARDRRGLSTAPSSRSGTRSPLDTSSVSATASQRGSSTPQSTGQSTSQSFARARLPRSLHDTVCSSSHQRRCRSRRGRDWRCLTACLQDRRSLRDIWCRWTSPQGNSSQRDIGTGQRMWSHSGSSTPPCTTHCNGLCWHQRCCRTVPRCKFRQELKHYSRTRPGMMSTRMGTV